MGIRRTEEFRNEAVRIALASGLSQKQVADDLGIGLSTLSKWIVRHKQTTLMSGSHDDKDKELTRLLNKGCLLKLGHLKPETYLTSPRFGVGSFSPLIMRYVTNLVTKTDILKKKGSAYYRLTP